MKNEIKDHKMKHETKEIEFTNIKRDDVTMINVDDTSIIIWDIK